MSDKMREEFEEWVTKQNVCVKYEAKLTQCRDGSYKDYRINDRWNSWKASRAARCVELPASFGSPRNDFNDGFEQALSWCKDALDAAGVRYK